MHLKNNYGFLEALIVLFLRKGQGDRRLKKKASITL